MSQRKRDDHTAAVEHVWTLLAALNRPDGGPCCTPERFCSDHWWQLSQPERDAHRLRARRERNRRRGW